jgi:hypothetical protein
MTAKHTPGPWGVNDRRQVVGGGKLIAALYGADGADGADNGPIIAAAPDLLAVAELLVECGHEDAALVAAAMRAIASVKATGET